MSTRTLLHTLNVTDPTGDVFTCTLNPTSALFDVSVIPSDTGVYYVLTELPVMQCFWGGVFNVTSNSAVISCLSVLCECLVYRCLSFCTLSFDHCVVFNLFCSASTVFRNQKKSS